MKALKYLIAISVIFTIFIGCKKTMNDDLSLVDTGKTPTKLNALFTITQDNSGLVSILPNGEAGAYYEIYFGDGTTTPAKVNAGAAATHVYPEGTFNVRIVAHDVTGKTAEFTKPLTVTFRAPENLVVTIAPDATNNFKLNVSATALYETFFKVYFGDVPNEMPLQFNEGTTVSHTYTASGTFTVRVVAFSGGVATTSYTQVVSIANQINHPVTFDNPVYNYTMTDFGGNISLGVFDPVVATNKVMKVTKPNGAEVWAGTTIGTPLGFASRIPVTLAASQMSVRVYSPAAGLKIKLKIEDHNDATKSVETDKLTTVANAWETLVFDFINQSAGTAALNPSYFFDKASIFFDFGNPGSGKIFYFDDVMYLPVNVPASGLALPIDFQSTVANFYPFTNFGNATTVVANNPSATGLNTSTKVGALTKATGAEVWAGSFLELASPINFSATNVIKMKVYSPQSGIIVKLKLENLANAGINIERDATTTVANAWQELTYTFNGIVGTNNYQRVVVFFNFGNPGTGLTYYFDDIKQ
jgi:hypothetical protein